MLLVLDTVDELDELLIDELLDIIIELELDFEDTDETELIDDDEGIELDFELDFELELKVDDLEELDIALDIEELLFDELITELAEETLELEAPGAIPQTSEPFTNTVTLFQSM